MTLEQMQLICNYILNHRDIRVIRNNRNCSSVASPRRKAIIIAEFVFDYSEELQLAEIIHEVCHFLPGCMNHGFSFREKEIYWLGQFGLVPQEYKRAYYEYLVSIISNKSIFRFFSDHQRESMSKRYEIKIELTQLKEKLTEYRACIKSRNSRVVL